MTHSFLASAECVHALVVASFFWIYWKKYENPFQCLNPSLFTCALCRLFVYDSLFILSQLTDLWCRVFLVHGMSVDLFSLFSVMKFWDIKYSHPRIINFMQNSLSIHTQCLDFFCSARNALLFSTHKVKDFTQIYVNLVDPNHNYKKKGFSWCLDNKIVSLFIYLKLQKCP